MFREINRIKDLDSGFYYIIIACLLSVCAFAIFLLSLLVKENAVNQKLKTSLNRLNLYEKTSTVANVPSEEKLKYLSAQLNELKKVYELLPSDLLFEKFEDLPLKGTNPVLDFKEHLFTVKQNLKKQASGNASPFPQNYGLEEFETRLPSKEKLPELNFLLSVVKELLGNLMDASAAEIKEFVFTETVETEFPKNEVQIYKEYFIRILFYASKESLVAFLNSLLEVKHIYQLLTIDIVPSDREKANKDEFKVELYLSLFKVKDKGK